MKREDFKEIKDVHFETCEIIINKKGRCSFVGCDNCPFTILNSENRHGCSLNNYKGDKNSIQEDEKLVKSAKEFLKFKEEKMEEKNLFQVGDKVWDIAFGHGIVNEIDTSSEDDFPVSIKYENCNIIWYTKTGIMTLGINRTLFFKEFDIKIPQEALERPRWRAKYGCQYRYVNSEGYNDFATETNSINDVRRFEIGNYFESIEKAEESKFFKVFHEEDQNA